MPSLVAKKRNDKTYYYAVWSARVDGKPRIVKQTYLGSLASMVEARERMAQVLVEGEPDHSIILEFGAVGALLDVAERLGVREIIDRHAGKRSQGLPVGDQILLAAINRAVDSKSKNDFFEGWFTGTVLPKTFPKATATNMSSQGFWNNMSILTEDKVRLIEEEISINAVKKYNIPINCLLFDNTNFFTYIDTESTSKLAKRGKSKEHRADLKIVGLSLLTSSYHNIPLFHEIYPGNTNDAKRFSDVIDLLKERYTKFGIKDNQVTLIFDRGNNSKSNVEKLIEETPCKFHFIGGLRQSQSNKLLIEAENSYSPLSDESLRNTTAYRTKKEEFGLQVTVVISHNPELYKKQMRGILQNISKCKSELDILINKLDDRITGKITGGRKYTIESLTKKTNDILHAEYMKEIFDINIFTTSASHLKLEYCVNEDKFENIRSVYVGKTVLFTDRHDWSNEEIISAYRSQYHVEECFKQLKNTKYLSFRPIRHFTDGKIIVHGLYCVIALMLCSLLNLELEKLGIKKSINKMIYELGKTKQIVTIYKNKNKNRLSYKLSFTTFNEISKTLMENYDIEQYSHTAITYKNM
jgi:transposase